MTIDIAALNAWTGRSEEASDLVTPRLADSFRATFGGHLAQTAPGEAPPALHWCLAPAIVPLDATGPDGHPAKGGFLPPVPLPRRMWAGGRLETLAPLRVGETVTRRSTIGEISYKDGRSGPLCFVAVHHDYLASGHPALRERHDIVYRAANPPGTAPTPAPVPPPAINAELVREVDTGPVFLFRYSALTFNGHRIHYDLPYATAEEGYAGLVVHGPVQATLMYNLAAMLLGRLPSAFDYRGVAPLTSGAPMFVKAGRREDGAVVTWTEGADGGLRMQGVATEG